jgi:hypothetical protein
MAAYVHLQQQALFGGQHDVLKGELNQLHMD